MNEHEALAIYKSIRRNSPAFRSCSVWDLPTLHASGFPQTAAMAPLAAPAPLCRGSGSMSAPRIAGPALAELEAARANEERARAAWRSLAPDCTAEAWDAQCEAYRLACGRVNAAYRARMAEVRAYFAERAA